MSNTPSHLSHQDVWVLKTSLTEALDGQLLIITRQPCELTLQDFVTHDDEAYMNIEDEEDYNRLEASLGVNTWQGEIVTFDFNGAYQGSVALLRMIPIHSHDEMWEAHGDEDLMRKWRFGNVPSAPLEEQKIDIENHNENLYSSPFHVDIRDMYDSDEDYNAAEERDEVYNEFIGELSMVVEQDDIGLILLLETHYGFNFIAKISEYSLVFRARKSD